MPLSQILSPRQRTVATNSSRRQVKLGDLGIARILDEEYEVDASEPMAQTLIGTPCFLSPE
jgi:serine/threonine protein kinase